MKRSNISYVLTSLCLWTGGIWQNIMLGAGCAGILAVCTTLINFMTTDWEIFYSTITTTAITVVMSPFTAANFWSSPTVYNDLWVGTEVSWDREGDRSSIACWENKRRWMVSMEFKSISLLYNKKLKSAF